MLRTLTVSALVLASATAVRSQDVSISTCGQVVPARASAVVANDITCDPTEPFVVQIEDRGSLDRSGFTLIGAKRGVKCVRKCSVGSSVGTGTIRDSGAGINAPSKVLVSNVALENNQYGVLGDFRRTQVRGEQVTITGGGFGIQASLVRIEGLTVTGSAPGLQVRRAVLDGCQITGCTFDAIRGGSARLANCTLSGNDPVDLELLGRPRLVNSTCERSRRLSNPVEDWGVCTND